jgi:hypothetical protein
MSLQKTVARKENSPYSIETENYFALHHAINCILDLVPLPPTNINYLAQLIINQIDLYIDPSQYLNVHFK